MYDKDVQDFISNFKKVKVQGGKKYDYYFINEKGVIISFKRDNPQVLKPKIGEWGYYQVGLRDENSNRKFYMIHRLVASTYIKNPNHKKYINHKDGNKLNNNVNNLEWVTVSENTQHAYDTGLNNSFSKECNLYYKDNFIKHFYSKSSLFRYVAEKLNCSKGHIRKCLEGRRNPSEKVDINNYSYVEENNDSYKKRGIIT